VTTEGRRNEADRPDRLIRHGLQGGIGEAAHLRERDWKQECNKREGGSPPLGGGWHFHGWSSGRVTVYEFSGRTRANARAWSAATRG
jgi:hypothetical protein